MAVANRLNVKISQNKSFFFLFPLFKINNRRGIKNSYLGDFNKEGAFDNNLYILSENIHNELNMHENLIDKYTVNDGIMYVLNVPDEYTNDYKKFLSGQYSKYSKQAKEILCRSACRNNLKEPYETEIYSVLHKTKARKEYLEKWLDVKLEDDAEYASIFNVESEMYDGEREE